MAIPEIWMPFGNSSHQPNRQFFTLAQEHNRTKKSNEKHEKPKIRFRHKYPLQKKVFAIEANVWNKVSKCRAMERKRSIRLQWSTKTATKDCIVYLYIYPPHFHTRLGTSYSYPFSAIIKLALCPATKKKDDDDDIYSGRANKTIGEHRVVN